MSSVRRRIKCSYCKDYVGHNVARCEEAKDFLEYLFQVEPHNRNDNFYEDFRWAQKELKGFFIRYLKRQQKIETPIVNEKTMTVGGQTLRIRAYTEYLEKTECAICLEVNSFGKDLAVLDCNHIFHTKCWKSYTDHNKDDLNCPQCRAQVEDVQYI